MTEYAENRRYGEDTVYGSLAYDFDSPQVFADPVYEDVDLGQAVETEETVVTASEARSTQALAPFAVLGYLFAAVLIVIALLAQVQLTRLSDQAGVLQSRLEELQLEETKLQIEYESAFNFTEIEKYAMSTLGMQKPRSDQIYYVNGSAPDRAVVLAEDTEEPGLLDRVSDLLSSFTEYLG